MIILGNRRRTTIKVSIEVNHEMSCYYQDKELNRNFTKDKDSLHSEDNFDGLCKVIDPKTIVRVVRKMSIHVSCH